jgi:hypothetical protein
MAAFRARCALRPGLLRVEVVATDAVKTDLPPLDIIERTVPPVIIEPKHGKQAQGEETVEQNRDR